VGHLLFLFAAVAREDTAAAIVGRRLTVTGR
jgi:hypothetical protein